MLMIKNIGALATMNDDGDDGVVSDAVVVIDGDKIIWCGSAGDYADADADADANTNTVIDANGCVVMPGLIDCHSHLIFAGDRAGEFTRRMNGESYEAIMRAGGGINATIKATALASDEELMAQAKARADKIFLSGVTTLEIKSGYGLNSDAEIRALRLAKKLDASHAIDIHPTFLGAHIVPKEFTHNRQDYVKKIIHEMLPWVAKEKLAIDCDVFCESGAFSFDEAKLILSTAKNLGLGLRAHVQQLGESGGVALVNELPLKSISHADFLSDSDINLLASKNTVVEALPFAALFLRSKKITPVMKLRQKQVPLAIATDFNPGSAMCNDLILAARLGVTYFGFSVVDALLGITKNAAQALGRSDIGQIKPGNIADLVITNCKSIDEIFYDWTKQPVASVIKNGVQRSPNYDH